MNRRHFIQFAGAALTNVHHLPANAASEGWRTFELKTRVEVLKPSGRTRVWLPDVLIRETPFQRRLGNELSAEAGTTEDVKHNADALGIITAEFPANVRPTVTLTSHVATKNYGVDLTSGR